MLATTTLCITLISAQKKEILASIIDNALIGGQIRARTSHTPRQQWGHASNAN